MTTVTIDVAQVGGIITTQQPEKEYKLLRELFLDKFGIDIEKIAVQVLQKSKLEESSSSSESDMLPVSPEQQKISSSDESLALSSDDNGGKSVARRRVFTEAAKIKENEIYEVGDYKLSFSGGSFLKIESNKDNIWIVCIKPPFTDGGAKEVHSVIWLLSCQPEGSIYYKEVPNKYVLSLFKQNKKEKLENETRFIQEVSVTHSFYTRTKKLFSIKESDGEYQYGFLMHDLGDSLFNIIVENKYSIDTRIGIAFSLIKKVEELILEKNRVHLDLKPDNICVNKLEVYLIDLDSVISLGEETDREISYTLSYLNKFIFDPDDGHYKTAFLKKGHYQILQTVSALVETCSYLINGNYPKNDRNIILPESFYKQVEKYFLTHLSNKHLLYGEFGEEMENIRRQFESLEISESNGASTEGLRENAINFAKENFKSLCDNLEDLRYNISIGFPGEVVKFEKETLKNVDDVLMLSQKVVVETKHNLYEVQQEIDSRIDLDFVMGTLNGVDLDLCRVSSGLNEVTPEFGLVRENLFLLKRFLTSAGKALLEADSKLVDTEESVDYIEEILSGIIISLDAVNVDLIAKRKEVDAAKGSIGLAEKILYSIDKSLETEGEVLEHTKEELSFLKKELDSRQLTLHLLQKKISKYKQEVQGWKNVALAIEKKASALGKKASEFERKVRELETKASEVESQASKLESEAVELEFPTIELENKDTHAANIALNPVQGEKRKHEGGRFQFWREPCSPPLKRARAKDDKGEALSLELRSSRSEP